MVVGKKILSTNFCKRHPSYYTKHDSMAVLYERDYDRFEKKLLYLLDPNNKKEVDKFYSNLKK